MFLIRGGNYPSLRPEVMEENRQKWFDWIGALNAKGSFVAGEPLLPTGRQVAGKKRSITDGPYLESKELVGGYMVILANDLEEAVEISKDCPVFEVDGKIEIRPVHVMSM